MHLIKNYSERNKIDTQSRADSYIRLISKNDYNLTSLDAPKSIIETEKTLKTLSSGQNYKKADPDPATQINADPCRSGSGYGSETLLETEKNPKNSLFWENL
jgi:hypothetical protein